MPQATNSTRLPGGVKSITNSALLIPIGISWKFCLWALRHSLTEDLPRYFDRDIRKVAAFFRNCALVVAGDSGIMHLASAAGVPVSGLFKMTNTRVYAPYNPESRAIDTRSLAVDELVAIAGTMLRSKNVGRT